MANNKKTPLLENLNKNIPIKNIYYMLSYILDTPIPSVVKNLDTEDFSNAYNFYAALMSRAVGHAVKQGLYREYRNICEDIPTVRGKINMPGTIRNKFSRRQLINCEHDELSENILFNRILKTTMDSLCHIEEVSSKYKNIFKKYLWRFSFVDIIKKPALIPWGSINFHRNNQHYRFLLSLCRLILGSLLLTTDEGGKRLIVIDADMTPNKFYEKFISAYYLKNYPDMFIGNRTFSWVLNSKSNDFLPQMEFDVMLTDGRNVLIIDAKYYGTILRKKPYAENPTLPSPNLYQIFAYVENWKLKLKNADAKTLKEYSPKFEPGEPDKPVQHKVSGMLLYARTNEEGLNKNRGDDEDKNKINNYTLLGNEIYVRTLDLSCEKFADIDKQLDDIVNNYFFKHTRDNLSYSAEAV